jgi:hypothetical protein
VPQPFDEAGLDFAGLDELADGSREAADFQVELPSVVERRHPGFELIHGLLALRG